MSNVIEKIDLCATPGYFAHRYIIPPFILDFDCLHLICIFPMHTDRCELVIKPDATCSLTLLVVSRFLFRAWIRSDSSLFEQPLALVSCEETILELVG